MLELRGRRVLIVEDEPIIAMMAEDVVLDAGGEVAGVAATVRDALVLLGRVMPDAVVLNLNLGGESAEPVVAQLAAMQIPTVIASAYGSVEVEGRIQRLHAVDKPYDGEALAQALVACRAARARP